MASQHIATMLSVLIQPEHLTGLVSFLYKASWLLQLQYKERER